MNLASSLECSSQSNLGIAQYERHQPEQTLLYQLIERYYPEFISHLVSQGAQLPIHVQEEFDAYLKCGRLA